MFRYRTEPYEHQRVALEKSSARRTSGIYEMGWQVEGLARQHYWLCDNKLIDTAVIVAPKGVYQKLACQSQLIPKPLNQRYVFGVRT